MRRSSTCKKKRKRNAPEYKQGKYTPPLQLWLSAGDEVGDVICVSRDVDVPLGLTAPDASIQGSYVSLLLTASLHTTTVLTNQDVKSPVDLRKGD